LKNNLRDLGIKVDYANPGVIAFDYFVVTSNLKTSQKYFARNILEI
jgi:hypothetical protein